MNSTKRQCWNCKFLGRETSDAYICKHELLQTTEQGFGINFKKDITVNSYCSLFESRIIYWFSLQTLTKEARGSLYLTDQLKNKIAGAGPAKNQP